MAWHEPDWDAMRALARERAHAARWDRPSWQMLRDGGPQRGAATRTAMPSPGADCPEPRIAEAWAGRPAGIGGRGWSVAATETTIPVARTPGPTERAAERWTSPSARAVTRGVQRSNRRR